MFRLSKVSAPIVEPDFGTGICHFGLALIAKSDALTVRSQDALPMLSKTIGPEAELSVVREFSGKEI